MPALNPFKTAIAARQPQIGLWLSMADPYLAEAAATTGYDWLLIDGEHAPNDLRSTLGALQAVASHPAQRRGWRYRPRRPRRFADPHR